MVKWWNEFQFNLVQRCWIYMFIARVLGHHGWCFSLFWPNRNGAKYFHPLAFNLIFCARCTFDSDIERINERFLWKIEKLHYNNNHNHNKNQPTNQLASQPTNQPNNQTTNQPTKQACMQTNKPTNKQTNKQNLTTVKREETCWNSSCLEPCSLTWSLHLKFWQAIFTILKLLCWTVETRCLHVFPFPFAFHHMETHGTFTAFI